MLDFAYALVKHVNSTVVRVWRWNSACSLSSSHLCTNQNHFRITGAGTHKGGTVPCSMTLSIIEDVIDI